MAVNVAGTLNSTKQAPRKSEGPSIARDSDPLLSECPGHQEVVCEY